MEGDCSIALSSGNGSGCSGSMRKPLPGRNSILQGMADHPHMNDMKKVLVFSAILLFLCIASDRASADNFWCGGKLILVGLTKYEVLNKCGEPNYKDFRYEKRIKRDFYRDLFPSDDLYRYRDRQKYREPLFVDEGILIEEWTYNLGPTRFIRYLIFENGRIVDILTGDYGF